MHSQPMMKSRYISYYNEVINPLGLGATCNLRFGNEGTTPIENPYGRLVLRNGNRDDIGVFREIFGPKDLYTIPSETKALIRSSRGVRVIDIGAHVGLATVKLLHQIRSCTSDHNNIFMVCVEPYPDNFGILNHNVPRYPHVSCVQVGISNESDQYLLTTNTYPERTSCTQTFVSKDPTNIGSTTMEDLIQDINAQIHAESNTNLNDTFIREHYPLIVKFDAEGAEQRVAQTPCIWLHDVMLLMTENHNPCIPNSFNLFQEKIFAAGLHLYSSVGHDLVYIRRQ